MREIILPNVFGSIQHLIKSIEDIRDDPDDCKFYEDNYLTGWIDACNTVLDLLHQNNRTNESDQP